MSEFVYQDQLDPDAYILDVTPGTSGADLSDVATAQFHVLRRADNTEVQWSAAISNQTSTTITLTYLFAAAAIDTVKGTYDVYARLTLSGGDYIRTATRVLVVKGKYEV